MSLYKGAVTWLYLTLLIAITAAIAGFWFPVAWKVLGYTALVLSGPVLMLGPVYLGNISERNQAKRFRELDDELAAYKDHQLDMFLRQLFEVHHPRYTGDQKRYDEWLIRYNKWFRRYTQNEDRYQYSLSKHLSVSNSLREKYESTHGRVDNEISGLPVIKKYLDESRISRYYKFIGTLTVIRRRLLSLG